MYLKTFKPSGQEDVIDSVTDAFTIWNCKQQFLFNKRFKAPSCIGRGAYIIFCEEVLCCRMVYSTFLCDSAQKVPLCRRYQVTDLKESFLILFEYPVHSKNDIVSVDLFPSDVEDCVAQLLCIESMPPGPFQNHSDRLIGDISPMIPELPDDEVLV